MTTTTPESRGRIAYTAYSRSVNFTTPDAQHHAAGHGRVEAGVAAAQAIWDLATTGRATIA